MVDFGMLLHAYGRATDTPGHLAALTGGDAEAKRAAQQHLWGAIIHQGTPWLATPPAALAVAALVGDPRLAGPSDAPLRANLLDFLGAVAAAGRSTDRDIEDLTPEQEAELRRAIEEDDDEAVYADEDLGNAVYGRAVAGCREIIPVIAAAARAALADDDAAVRASGAATIGACGIGTDGLAALAAAAGPDERAAIVLTMAELGEDVRPFLTDPHPGVRACAALAPALADDEAAIAEILAALEDPAAIETWFGTRPPQFPMHVRFPLIAAAVDRVADRARLLPAALALAPIVSVNTVRYDWGVLLQALPHEQRRVYLHALADHEELWDPANGSAGLMFEQAGLPYDRAASQSA
ncbi:hypothetical protein [Dactylosporangium matsuzakiense]|uniref:HEAT repeat protein n=1 Tax=Dactylosporangium matsuzakiense TaxID=53360 RepID=A0A9W6KRX1_9ACTN|nr:hypothetical protein [Dactylosporangium matsuzakiense]UWZ41475.1 hypothetical protein Dmats_27845 [Dactylosporangium matsuzakiense]GLL07036.1 hypothetical protein GCM10017581_087870 [Dactylosporangium matsuzakiense]